MRATTIFEELMGLNFGFYEPLQVKFGSKIHLYLQAKSNPGADLGKSYL